ncbi:MAG: hypothetical protein RR277_01440 [Rikenellaceae bacterium]
MTTDKVNNIFTKFSQTISYLLHPLLIMLYIAMVVLFGNTYINSPDISLKFKLILLGIIAFMTVVVPLVSFYILHCLKLVSNFRLPLRNDRIFPLLIVAISYLACMFICSQYIGKVFAQKTFFTIALLVSVTNVLTFNLRISFHAVGIAAALAFFIALSYIGYGDMQNVIIATLLLSGLLSTCRLYLGKHNITEVSLSYLFGLLFTLLILWL